MLARPRRPSIADQVSSSLQDPSGFSSPHNISTNDSADDHQDDTSPQKGPTTVEQPEDQDLPSFEECLYGSASGKGPFIPEDDYNDEISEDDNDANNSDDKKKNDDGLNISIDDDELNSRWSQNPDVRIDYHDIDMSVLRKICSHGSGIPDEEGPHDMDNDSNLGSKLDSSNSKRDKDGIETRGKCHRGVIWRILLEQLPSRDIHATWPQEVPPQRMLYRELIEKYMENAVDPGRKLKGESHWQQSVRTNSNDSSSDEVETEEGEWGENGNKDDENKTEDGRKPNSDASLKAPPQAKSDGKSWSASTEFNDSAEIRATEDIYDVFPPTSKYKELWRKCGIILNQGESAAAIGMNRLKVPKELLSEESDENNRNDDDQKAESDTDDLANVDTDNPFLWGDSYKRSKKDDIFCQFCKDAKLLSEIRKDVVRTNPHLRFYLETEKNFGIRRHAAIERILFIWARLNDHLYVQGMNEIVGTIYYVLAMDPTKSVSSEGDKHERRSSWADHAEADTYFLFHSLMIRMEVRDVFVADLDHDGTCGLHARIANVETLLQKHDPDVFNHLREHLGIDSSFYVIRWLTTLLSREFRLPDTIRLWDSLLASTHKENFLRYVCASMVMSARDRLLRSDFGTCLKLLQNYPSGEIGMDELLESSRNLWLYETKIALACDKGGITLRKALRIVPVPEGITMAFGKVGPKPLRLKSPTSKNESENDNKNVGNFMGAAKRLWRWGVPSQNGTENGTDSQADLIDSIIDGKAEFVNQSMSSASSSIEDTKAGASDQDESNSKAGSTDVGTPPRPPRPPPPPPAMSPFRFWNRGRSAPISSSTPQLPDESQSAPLRVWNSSNGDSNPTKTAATNNNGGSNDVEEFRNNGADSLSVSERVEAKTIQNSGRFWNRIRRRSMA